MSALTPIIIICGVFIWLITILKPSWYKKLENKWLLLKLMRDMQRAEQKSINRKGAKSKLEKAREAVKNLRAGSWMVYSDWKQYLDIKKIVEFIDTINEALEAGWSYKQIGTNKNEVIGFRNGDAHKTTSLLQLKDSREFKYPHADSIIELASDAGFPLEDIGTNKEELKFLKREYYRRRKENFVQNFRNWAMGAPGAPQYPDKFEKEISGLLAGEHYAGKFTYEELGISAQEYTEIMCLARRREVTCLINDMKRIAEKGKTRDCDFYHKQINGALRKAGLTLSNFNLTESDLAEIQRSAYIAESKNLLSELRTPGENWFYSEPSTTKPHIRLYKPVLWGCIPGDPLYFVKKIKKSLTTANATLADIGASEPEIKKLVRTGHVVSAKFILKELKQVAQTPRRTKFALVRSMLSPKHVIMDDPRNTIDRKALEDPYPIERDLEAIEYHLKGAGIKLEDIGSSTKKLKKLKITIESR